MLILANRGLTDPDGADRCESKISQLEGIDETFDAMLIVAAHSMAGTTKGVLSHTFSDGIMNMWINGIRVGEIGFWAATAGHYDVPTILVVNMAH